MNNELTEQLNHVIHALEADFYHPLADLSLQGFAAENNLTPGEAELRPREPWPEGTVWGNAI